MVIDHYARNGPGRLGGGDPQPVSIVESSHSQLRGSEAPRQEALQVD